MSAPTDSERATAAMHSTQAPTIATAPPSDAQYTSSLPPREQQQQEQQQEQQQQQHQQQEQQQPLQTTRARPTLLASSRHLSATSASSLASQPPPPSHAALTSPCFVHGYLDSAVQQGRQRQRALSQRRRAKTPAADDTIVEEEAAKCHTPSAGANALKQPASGYFESNHPEASGRTLGGPPTSNVELDSYSSDGTVSHDDGGPVRPLGRPRRRRQAPRHRGMRGAAEPDSDPDAGLGVAADQDGNDDVDEDDDFDQAQGARRSASSFTISSDELDSNEEYDDRVRSLTRQLAETAVGVREMSKQLGRARVKSTIHSVMIITKARDNHLIKLTRELALWLMRTPRNGRDRGLIVYVDSQLRTSKRFDAEGIRRDYPQLFTPIHHPNSARRASTHVGSMGEPNGAGNGNGTAQAPATATANGSSSSAGEEGGKRDAANDGKGHIEREGEGSGAADANSAASSASLASAKPPSLSAAAEGQLRYWTADMCSRSPHLFDFVVTLGGDGTVLFCSWLFQRTVPPVMPFALGSLGFLTNFNFEHYADVMRSALDNGVRVNLRMRFTATVYRATLPTDPRADRRRQRAIKSGKTGEIMMRNIAQGGWERIESPLPRGGRQYGADGDATTSSAPLAKRDKEIMCFSTRPVETFEVLNDLVVDRGPSPYVSLLEVFGDEHHMTTAQADGLCISTPTGSTAYSLSAGGSLVHPEIPAILITPICPHTLSFRPMLLPDSMELRIAVPYNSRSTAWASFDGRGRVELKQGDHIKVTASRYPFPTVCAENQSTDWFESISRTLKWNERQRQKSFVVVEEGGDDRAGTDEAAAEAHDAKRPGRSSGDSKAGVGRRKKKGQAGDVGDADHPHDRPEMGETDTGRGPDGVGAGLADQPAQPGQVSSKPSDDRPIDREGHVASGAEPRLPRQEADGSNQTRKQAGIEASDALRCEDDDDDDDDEEEGDEDAEEAFDIDDTSTAVATPAETRSSSPLPDDGVGSAAAAARLLRRASRSEGRGSSSGGGGGGAGGNGTARSGRSSRSGLGFLAPLTAVAAASVGGGKQPLALRQLHHPHGVHHHPHATHNHHHHHYAHQSQRKQPQSHSHPAIPVAASSVPSAASAPVSAPPVTAHPSNAPAQPASLAEHASQAVDGHETKKAYAHDDGASSYESSRSSRTTTSSSSRRGVHLGGDAYAGGGGGGGVEDEAGLDSPDRFGVAGPPEPPRALGGRHLATADFRLPPAAVVVPTPGAPRVAGLVLAPAPGDAGLANGARDAADGVRGLGGATGEHGPAEALEAGRAPASSERVVKDVADVRGSGGGDGIGGGGEGGMSTTTMTTTTTTRATQATRAAGQQQQPLPPPAVRPSSGAGGGLVAGSMVVPRRGSAGGATALVVHGLDESDSDETE